jgi:hypothetical protein
MSPLIEVLLGAIVVVMLAMIISTYIKKGGK